MSERQDNRRSGYKRFTGRRSKRLSRSGFLALFLLLGIVGLATLLLLLRFHLLHLGRSFSVDPRDQLLASVQLPLDTMEANHTYPLGDRLLFQLDQQQIRVLNLAGTEEYRFDASIQNPVVAQVADRFLVYDRLGFQYFVLSSEGVVHQGKTDYAILSHTFASNGAVAFVLQGENRKGVVRVLNQEGNSLFDLTIQDHEKSGFVLQTLLDDTHEILYVSMLNISGSEPFPVIQQYALDSKNLGRMKAELKPPVSEGLPILCPYDSEGLILMGATKILNSIGDACTPVFADVQAVSHAGRLLDGCFCVAAEAMGGPYYFHSIHPGRGFPERVSSGYRLVEPPRQIQACGNYVVALIGDDLYRFAPGRESKPDVIPFYGRLIRFSVDERGTILCVCSDGIRQIAN